LQCEVLIEEFIKRRVFPLSAIQEENGKKIFEMKKRKKKLMEAFSTFVSLEDHISFNYFRD